MFFRRTIFTCCEHAADFSLSASPTVRDIYLAVAALGGHIKYAGDPGWLTLARGLEKLETLTEGWIAAKLHLTCDQR